MNTVPSSLVWATDYDVLPADHVVERRDGYLLVRSPGNPAHWWGNLLLFDDAPKSGDGDRWERLFAHEFGGDPRVAHVTLAWDRVDGALGSAREEFVARGYELDEVVGLVAEPGALRMHPRANQDVLIGELDPFPAEPDYHALGLYESLGFQRVERVAGVCRRPTTRSTA